MSDNIKKKSQFVEMLPIMGVMLLFPIFLFTIIFYTLCTKREYPLEASFNFSLMVACSSSLLFYLTLAISGLFQKSLHVVVKRISEFFNNLAISFKSAMKWYFEDLFKDGIIFWLYMLVIAANVYGAIVSFIYIYNVYIIPFM